MKTIALTAYSENFNQQQALLTGFQRHLTKPVEPEVSPTAVTALIEKSTHE